MSLVEQLIHWKCQCYISEDSSYKNPFYELTGKKLPFHACHTLHVSQDHSRFDKPRQVSSNRIVF